MPTLSTPLHDGAHNQGLSPFISRQPPLLIGGGFVLLYVLLSWLAHTTMTRPFAIAPWHPAGGIALALLLVFGIRYWPALGIAALSTALMLRDIPPFPYTPLLAPMILTLGYVVMAAILRGPLQFRLAFDHPAEIAKLVGVATAITFVMAVAYVAVFRGTGGMPEQEFRPIVLRFWIGHLIGIVINTPLLLLILSGSSAKLNAFKTSLSSRDAAFFAGITVLTLWIIFGLPWADHYKLFYLLFLPAIWVATRYGVIGAVIGMACIQLGIIFTLINSQFESGTAVTEFQFMMLTLTVATFFIGTAVTQNHHALRALRKSESRFRTTVATAHDSILTIDQAGLIVDTNAATTHIFGYEPSNLIGLPASLILPELELKTVTSALRWTRGLRADNTFFPAEASLGITADSDGKLMIVIVRDMTKHMNNVRLFTQQHEELSRALRLAATGEMTAALAHELHQPLTAIRNYSYAARLQFPASSVLMEKIEREAARAATLVQRLRNFFRGDSSAVETIDVTVFLRDTLAPVLDKASSQGIILEAHTTCHGVMLLIDRIQIGTAIRSLINNSIEAMQNTAHSPRLITVSALAENNDWVRVSIADNGPGIAQAMSEHMFEPYATDKFSGTGMGLPISRAMIEAHGGRIWFESSDQGTTFHLTLPTTLLERELHE